MYTGYFKQTWFVVLLLIAISCSAVSNAFAQPMHALMAIQSTASKHCGQQVDQAQDIGSHQHQEQSAQVAQAHPHSSDACQTTPALAHHQSVKACADCSTLYCQISHLAISHNATMDVNRVWDRPSNIAQTAYHAQHLSGFHQEILRPPRA